MGDLVDLDRPTSFEAGTLRKGDPRAVELGRRGAAAREAKRKLVRADSAAVAAHLAALRPLHERADLGATALGVAFDLLGRVSRGEIPVRNGAEVAELFRALVDVVRLESGESTSNAAVVHVGSDALERFRALQVEARSVLGISSTSASSSVQAADDVVPVLGVDGAEMVGVDTLPPRA